MAIELFDKGCSNDTTWWASNNKMDYPLKRSGQLLWFMSWFNNDNNSAFSDKFAVSLTIRGTSTFLSILLLLTTCLFHLQQIQSMRFNLMNGYEYEQLTVKCRRSAYKFVCRLTNTDVLVHSVVSDENCTEHCEHFEFLLFHV